jgi:hypothetical protein
MDLVAGIGWLLSGSFAAAPHELWWDNEAGIGRRGRLTEAVTALIGTLGSRLVQLKPYDPESKGIVERANRYLETSFLPGRTFTGPQDFNDQLRLWLWLPGHGPGLDASPGADGRDRQLRAARAGSLNAPPATTTRSMILRSRSGSPRPQPSPPGLSLLTELPIDALHKGTICVDFDL